MCQSFKSLADGDDGTSLIGVTASMWVKVKICRVECVTMKMSVARSLAINAPRSSSLIEFWNYVLVFVLTALSW